jgi:hypothetical protein
VKTCLRRSFLKKKLGNYNKIKIKKMCHQKKLDEMVQVLVAEAITHYYQHNPYSDSPDGFYRILRHTLEKAVSEEIGKPCHLWCLNVMALDALMDFGREAAAKVVKCWVDQES